MVEAMTFEAALRKCGVTDKTLTPREKDALDRDGYVVLPGVLDGRRLATLWEAFEAAIGAGHRRGITCALDWKDAAFDGVATHPRALAAVYHVLRRPFVVCGLQGRDPQPGLGQQGLHTDGMPTVPREPFRLVTALWLLDDFTPGNGATRVVPGSHRACRPLPKAMAQPESRHPEQQTVVAAVGSVLLFNGDMLQSGTRNVTGQRRRVLQGQYVARDTLPPNREPPDLPGRFTPAVRYLLGA